MRSAGSLTRRDRDQLAAMQAALRTAAALVEPMLAAAQAGGRTMTPVLRQLARAAAMVEAFDAQPRHRELPEHETVVEWLDRHTHPADDWWRPDDAPAGPVPWSQDLPGAGGVYSHATAMRWAGFGG